MMGQAWGGGSPYFDERMGYGQQPMASQDAQSPQQAQPMQGGMMQQRGGWGGFGGGGNYGGGFGGGGYGGGFRNPMAQALRMYGSRMSMGGGRNMGMPMQSDKLPLANGGDPTLPPSAPPPAGQSGNSQDAISNALATGNQAGLQGQGSQATNTDLNNSFYQQGVETPWYQQNQAQLNRQGPAYQPGGIFGGPARNMGAVPV